MLRTACPLLVALLTSTSCQSGHWKDEADEQVYGILEAVAERVTGEKKTFPIERNLDDQERPIDTLRTRILLHPELEFTLSLLDALDIAAENSRDFQRQKESLYLAALNLTRDQHEFALRWGAGGSAEVDGLSDTETDVSLRDDLSASVNTVAGTRIVTSFVNNFLRSVVHGGTFDGSSILSMTISQPLLRGAGARIVRESLTQAERDVVYQMRDFERARAALVVRVFSDYYGIAQQIADLDSQQRNYESVRRSEKQSVAMFGAGRKTFDDVGRSRQQVLTAENGLVNSRARLDTTMDRFKITLGLPTRAGITLDVVELERLRKAGVEPLEFAEEGVIALALSRRFDLRTVRDEVDDAARRVLVSEDALGMALDFSAAVTVPDQPGASANLDFSKISWAAGFDLDLALDKLPERNAFRSALINLDVAIRGRDQFEDQVTADVRASLRDIDSRLESYRIQQEGLALALRRVEAAEALFDAGRGGALDVLDAKSDLLSAELNVTDAIVSYNIARLTLMHDLEAIVLEPTGLRYDPTLPLPTIPAPAPAADL